VAISLAQLATELGLDWRGESGAQIIEKVAALHHAQSNCLSFCGHPRYRHWLSSTKAGAVIVRKEDSALCSTAVLITDNPYLAVARALELLHPPPCPRPGLDPSAIIAASARIAESATISALCVIENDVEIGDRVYIGPSCIIRQGACIKSDSRLVANVVVCEHSIIGERAVLHPGVVIGREGFGFARDGDQWVKIPQIGCVQLGNDVEVGANSTIDRGALEDTVIADGVKIDSLVHIGHNVSIGEHTAMAACSGISGSTHIGRRCTIAGAVGMAGHLQIGDDVHFTGMAMVTRSIVQSGTYSSGIPAMPNSEWRRMIARCRRLEQFAQRFKRLEDQLYATGDLNTSNQQRDDS
jgi:UDP-3-O-[3-hydroxymyristoyl] glucosamine N-acyltransferase